MPCGEGAPGILEEVQIVGALQPIGDRTQNAEPNTLGFRVTDKVECLVHELQVEAWIRRLLIHICLPELLAGTAIFMPLGHV